MDAEHCYIFLPGMLPGYRIGIIARGHLGHQISGADQREWSDDMAKQYVDTLNALLWITPVQERELRDAARASHHRRQPMRIIALIVLAVLAFVILAVPSDALSYSAWTVIVAAFIIGCVVVATSNKKPGIWS